MLDPAPSAAPSREDRVKAMAYAIWLEEGRPEGRAEAHWFRALERLDAEAVTAPAPARRKHKAAAAAKTATPRRKPAR